MNCPPPLGSPHFARGTARGLKFPRFARGTKPRAHAVTPARRGNLKEGVTDRGCFRELWWRDSYYMQVRRLFARMLPVACAVHLVQAFAQHDARDRRHRIALRKVNQFHALRDATRDAQARHA